MISTSQLKKKTSFVNNKSDDSALDQETLHLSSEVFWEEALDQTAAMQEEWWIPPDVVKPQGLSESAEDLFWFVLSSGKDLFPGEQPKVPIF